MKKSKGNIIDVTSLGRHYDKAELLFSHRENGRVLCTLGRYMDGYKDLTASALVSVPADIYMALVRKKRDVTVYDIKQEIEA